MRVFSFLKSHTRSQKQSLGFFVLPLTKSEKMAAFVRLIYHLSLPLHLVKYHLSFQPEKNKKGTNGSDLHDELICANSELHFFTFIF